MTARERNREVILQSAARAIADKGYHGMSMRQLARETGRGLASFYNYFASKEDVLFALQVGAFETLLEALDQALRGVDDPVGRLHVLVLNHVRYFTDHPEVMRILVHEATALPADRRSPVRVLKERYFETGRDILRDVLQRGCGRPGTGSPTSVDEAELERVTYAVFGMLNWVWGWYDPERHGSDRDVARTIHRVAVCGMVADCPHRPEQSVAEAALDDVPRPSPLRCAALAGRELPT